MSDLSIEQEILYDELSDNHAKHIAEIAYLEDFIIDAMKAYATYKNTHLANEETKPPESQALALNKVIPRILHFKDESGNNVDLNAAGVNAKLLRDGTFEYFISYGFAGRKELTPVYEVQRSVYGIG